MAERQAYANDLGDARALIAVTAKSNRSKSDQDPSTWMPPAEGSRCDYVAKWVAIKTRWKLANDPSEEAALAENATRCPNTPVTVRIARQPSCGLATQTDASGDASFGTCQPPGRQCCGRPVCAYHHRADS